MRDRKGNERGVWESASLVRFNDDLLRSAGAAWWCPPPASHDWSAEIEARADEAVGRFHTAHRGPYWTWKDPRNCLTLPFWLAALRQRPAAIVVLRNPLEIAASLTSRNGFAKAAVLALWERYVRAVLGELAGMAVLVSRYEDLLSDPVRWCSDTARFLADAGNPVDPTRAILATGYLDNRLRHAMRSLHDLDADRDATDDQRQLATHLMTLCGAHARFGVPALGRESPTTERFFAAQRAAHGLGRPGRHSGAAPSAPMNLFAAGTRRAKPRGPAVSIIVISRDEGTWLDTTIARLTSTVPTDTELIVVDDCSSDGSTERLADRRRVRVVRPELRLGIARARNFGATLAHGRLLVFSDAHVDPTPGWLAAMRTTLDVRGVGAANPAIVDLVHRDRTVNGLTFHGRALNVRWVSRPAAAAPFDVPLLTGCFVAIRRDAFDAVGGFDEGMDGYGAEDLELCLRLWRTGYRCVSVPGARVAHRFVERGRQRIDPEGFLHNLLRMASVHLGEERLRQVVDAVRREPAFSSALARVLAGETGRRRREIEALCWYSDRWYFERFAPDCFAAPQLSDVSSEVESQEAA